MKTTKKIQRTPRKGDPVMKIRGKDLYLTGKVVDVFTSRGVRCALVAHRNILHHIEYFTSTLKQLEVL
jgi:hypothetical protein